MNESPAVGDGVNDAPVSPLTLPRSRAPTWPLKPGDVVPVRATPDVARIIAPSRAVFRKMMQNLVGRG